MKNQIQQLLDDGQSVWLDNLRRNMFESGELKRLIDRGLRGMTSNPTIFEKAIGAGSDYDEQLATLVGSEKSADALFWDLAIQDIQSACDAFASVYESSGGNDGFVSLEVSPLLANDTAGTIAMVQELWGRVKRPNVMIKIPGTKAGLPAIEESIYRGYNINVTLVFSVEMYERAAQAYVKGLQRRIAEGKPIDAIRSVNSVFVSRIDTAIDKLLQDRIGKGEKLEPLLGKTGVANLKLTYQKFKEIFYGDAFAPVRAKGGAVQRPLWASTSTKNPQYPDLMYVETVVGPDTVNTMPPATLEALFDHGTIVADTVESDLGEANDVMRALQDAKISLFDVTHDLQVEGVALFSDSFAALLGAIVYKQKLLESGGAERVQLSMGPLQPIYDAALEKLVSADFLKRIWAHDATLWSTQPDDIAIIKKSLGWLDIQQRMLEEVPGLRSFAKEAKEHFDFAVVCGMGEARWPPTFSPTPSDAATATRSCTSSIRRVRNRSRSWKRKSTSARRSSSSPARAARPPSPTPFMHTSTRRSVSRSDRPRQDATSLPLPIPERRSTKRRRRHPSARTSRTIRISAAAIRHSRSSASRPRRLPDTTSTYCWIARSGQCTPTIARSTPEARPAFASAQRLAASRRTAATSLPLSRIRKSKPSGRGPSN